jgi:hypothetical protein
MIMDDDIIRPANIPEPILEHPQAINLYVIAVGSLALIGVTAILGAMILAFFDKVIPDAAWAIVGIAVGALAFAVRGQV